MQDSYLFFKPIILSLTILLLVCLTVAVAYLAKSLYKFSKIISRLELLTDLKGWIETFKAFGKRKKKTSKED